MNPLLEVKQQNEIVTSIVIPQIVSVADEDNTASIFLVNGSRIRTTEKYKDIKKLLEEYYAKPE